MALVNCHECGNPVSTEASACPKCGAPVRRVQVTPVPPAPPQNTPKPSAHVQKPGSVLWPLAITGMLIFLGGIGVISILSKISTTPGTRNVHSAGDVEARRAEFKRKEEERLAKLTPEQRKVEEEAARKNFEEAEARRLEQEKIAAEKKAAEDEESRQKRLISDQLSGKAWIYTESEDPMTGKVDRSAVLASINEFELGFPYSGPQRAKLVLRNHSRHGRDVMVSIDRGQFSCGVSSCTVTVRFGKGAPSQFTVNEAAGGDNTTLFIQNVDRFMSGLRKSDTVAVEALLFQEGNKVFQFETAGLEWK